MVEILLLWTITEKLRYLEMPLINKKKWNGFEYNGIRKVPDLSVRPAGLDLKSLVYEWTQRRKNKP